MMKAVGIVGSPRPGGNTEILVSEALRVLREEGIETEMILLAGKSIKGCDACQACSKTGECAVDDDMEPIRQKMLAADAIIVGSPVYYSGATPETMALLHRVGYSSRALGRPFERKVGGPIAVARRAGQNFALAEMMYFFLITGMIVPGSTYWNMAFGREKGEVLQDEEGLRTIRNFAQNVAWLLKKIKA